MFQFSIRFIPNPLKNLYFKMEMFQKDRRYSGNQYSFLVLPNVVPP